ncbi:hypothetical protein, variant 2 [Exophiala sideris]|uniref:Uncharacterized protein n=1 Tax=Exophiala sideris TaxID=1016849 RepID=A0A0D1Y8S0_9EURO|nr:hypothetical protein PV11_09017 [Exophiala sideris]KIV77199.1 hypothetical protein, variant 1 [Exophiala sideris]KIV77200.1 hypothetical protein, variant 2 [Exophiala sideris]
MSLCHRQPRSASRLAVLPYLFENTNLRATHHQPSIIAGFRYPIARRLRGERSSMTTWVTNTRMSCNGKTKEMLLHGLRSFETNDYGDCDLSACTLDIKVVIQKEYDRSKRRH